MALPAILALAQFAPTIAKIFTGDKTPPKILNTISSVAKTVSGADTVEDALAIFQKNGEKAWEFKTAMAQMEQDLILEHLKDRQNARNRDIELVKAGYGNHRADILAYTAIAVLALLTFMLLFQQIPDGPGRDVLLMIVGALIIIVKDVYAFEFGTSRSSKEKDMTIATLSQKD